jgi:hypothetical protein
MRGKLPGARKLGPVSPYAQKQRQHRRPASMQIGVQPLDEPCADVGELFEDRGHQVVAAAGDAEDLLTLVAEHHPDLVVVDVCLPPTFTDEGTESVRIPQCAP